MLRRSIVAGAVCLALTCISSVASGAAMNEISLHAAAAMGDVAGIQKLLSEGVTVDVASIISGSSTCW